MNHRHLLAVLLCAAAANAQLAPRPGGELPATPEHQASRAAGPITVDGALDEPSWRSAAPLALQFFWPEQTGAKQATRVRLVWDDQALYAGYECDDADITARHTNRDDKTYEDDCVELFLLPDRQRWPGVYVGLEMNARGVLYDYLTVPPLTVLKRFQLDGCEVATQLQGTLNRSDDTDTGWTLEVKIPWANLEEFLGRAPAAGDRWGLMLNRWDGTEPNRALSLWSDSGTQIPSPHNADRFGALVLAAAAPTLGPTPGPEPPAGTPDWAQIENPVVGFETTKGTFYLELWPDVAPKHAANLIKLVQARFYDGIVVHRVVPGFVAQIGCPFTRDNPLDDERIGTGGPGWTVDAEFSDRPHLRGTLSMARTTDPNSAGSQFFICLDPQPGLNGNYSVFGHMLGEGMAVVDELVVGDKIVRAFVVHE